MNSNNLFRKPLVVSISNGMTNGSIPVTNATDVKLELAVVSQQALLHQVKVDWLVVNDNRAHAALIGQGWIPTTLIG